MGITVSHSISRHRHPAIVSPRVLVFTDVETGSRRQPAAQGIHSRCVGQPQLVGPGLLEILPSSRGGCLCLWIGTFIPSPRARRDDDGGGGGGGGGVSLDIAALGRQQP